MTQAESQHDAERLTIVGLGEVLWDVFPDGQRFGGAPANFACAAAELCQDRANVHVASGVGRDELGRRAIESLIGHNVDASCVAQLEQQTGTVTVQLSDSGSASYEFAADTAWDNLLWSTQLEELAARTDAVCFGTLGQRSAASRKTIQRFVTTVPTSSLRVFDVNVRSPFVSDAVILESLEIANVLKLNDEELPVLARLCGQTGSDADMLRQIAQQFDLAAVALTRGAEGAIVLCGENVTQCPGVKTAVVDTVGAGDAFTAVFVLGLLRGRPLLEIGHSACQVAAHVCSQRGATLRLPASMMMT